MACCSLPADVLWGSFVKHSFLHEWVTNEPQRMSAGRLGLLESSLNIKPPPVTLGVQDLAKDSGCTQ